MRRTISSAILQCAAVGLLATVAVSDPTARAEEVLIGAQLPLSGPLAAFAGPRLRAGAEVAVEEINSSQMLGPGRTIKLSIEDDAGDKTQTLALINKRATVDHVTAIFGPTNSSLALPAAPVANELKVPMLAIGASAAIVEAGPWSFMSLVPANKMVASSVKLATGKLGVKSVAVIFDRTNSSSVLIKNAFEAAVKERGVQVVVSEGISPQDSNFGPLATKLASMKFDALYIESIPTVLANFVIQVKQAGLDPKTRIIASPNAGTNIFTEIGGKAVEGTYYETNYLAASDTPENKKFVAAYKKKTGNETDSQAANGYGGMMVLAEALKIAGPNADRDKVRLALGQVHDVPSVYGTGRYSIDKNRLPDFQNIVVQIVDGKPKVVPLD
jgi:branched-chain amino acid transport system substrate-binding protein